MLDPVPQPGGSGPVRFQLPSTKRNCSAGIMGPDDHEGRVPCRKQCSAFIWLMLNPFSHWEGSGPVRCLPQSESAAQASESSCLSQTETAALASWARMTMKEGCPVGNNAVRLFGSCSILFPSQEAAFQSDAFHTAVARHQGHGARQQHKRVPCKFCIQININFEESAKEQ